MSAIINVLKNIKPRSERAGLCALRFLHGVAMRNLLAIYLFLSYYADLRNCAFLSLFLEIADFIFVPNYFLLFLMILEPLSLWGKTLCTNLFVPHPS
jgi:hypothetical protein